MPADLSSFGDRKSTNTRMGPAKVPQPGVESHTWLPLRDPWLAPSKKKGRHQCLPNEEKQVDINVFQITVVATLGCIDGTWTQSTSKKMLSGSEIADATS
jgi:hypothetical protein